MTELKHQQSVERIKIDLGTIIDSRQFGQLTATKPESKGLCHGCKLYPSSDRTNYCYEIIPGCENVIWKAQ